MESGDIMGLLIAVGGVVIGLPWIVLHYITKWKTAATLTGGDEALLDDLYQLAKRLDERMDTVERLVRSEHPEFTPGLPLNADVRQGSAVDKQPLREYEQQRGIPQSTLERDRAAYQANFLGQNEREVRR